MTKPYKMKLENVINDLSYFLEKDYSSRFKTLTDKEDRQLFFLARILTKLKLILEEVKEDEKILVFPTLAKTK